MEKKAMPNLKSKLRKRIRVKDLPLSSRPREKLVDRGNHNLSDAEIVAILLGTGSSKQNVLQLSETLLRHYPVEKLKQVSLSELLRFPGIGKAKASRIVAALELGNRLFAQPLLNKVTLRSTQDVVAQVRDIMEKKQEFLVVFYLNARYEVLQREVVGQGSLNTMVITAKEIFSPALTTPCAFLIVVHNHPSGDPTPSEDDIAFTTRIQEAGEVMGIPMLDHLIVTTKGCFSFRENKTQVKLDGESEAAVVL